MSTRRTNLNLPKPKLGNRDRERRSPRRTKTPSSNELKNKYKFSPKGKRKLDFPFKGKKPGPLAGKLFYLDLNGSRYNATQLKKNIEQLGGTIEEFFRKEVTYLVTSRGDCGKSPSSQSAPSPGTPSPIPLSRSSSLKNYAAASPMSTDSPQGLDNHIQVPKGTMRGKSIAQRSAGFKKGTIDILTNATTWGVNILHVDHVMKWFSQLISKAYQQQGSYKQKTTSPSKRVSQAKLPKVVPLKETYIKVEDVSFKYRPLVHEFKIWPEITFDSSNVCPFDPPRRRSSGSSYNKRKSGEGNVKKPAIHERPRNGYCECCEARYSDLDTHLRGKQHKEFAKNDSNYSSLDKAINEGPKIEDLKEIHFKKSRSSDNSPVLKKSTASASSGNTDDVENDEVFLVSTPRSSRQNKSKIPDHLSPNKGNLHNRKEQQKVTSPDGDRDKGNGNFQKADSVPKPRAPTTKTMCESNLRSTDIENPKCVPGTRLQKSSSNHSSLGKNKPRSSNNDNKNGGKTATVMKNKGDGKDIKRSKRKSTEVVEECNQADMLQRFNKTCGNVMVLQGLGNEHYVQSTTTARKVISNVKSTKKEYKSELQPGEENNELKYKTEQTSELAKQVPGDNCDESVIKSPCTGKRNRKVNRNLKSLDDKMGVRGSKESDQHRDEERNHKLRRNKRKCKKTDFDFSDTEKDEEESKDSPLHLNTPTKNVPNGDHFAMCPGALIEEESALTVRSVRRRKSAVGSCKLSPISPCNHPDGEYSVRSSCSEDIEFLPSGLRIYSSFGSSLDGVSKDVKDLVDRMGEQLHSDGGNVAETPEDAKSEMVCGRILRERNVDSSSSMWSKDVSQIKEQVESTNLQVPLNSANTEPITFAAEKDGDCSRNFKRKRNDETEPTNARKCKRISVDLDSRPDDASESEVLDTSVSNVLDTYRSSVAERVKLNRALFESLQACSSPFAEPLSSPEIHFTGRKRGSALHSSPFAEITNTCKKRRERAQSEECRIKTSTRSNARKTKSGRTGKHPRSACLTPNDPFNFDDF